MQNSSLEITDQEYLIKLSKNDFDLLFIHQLLKRIQTERSCLYGIPSDEGEDIKTSNPGIPNSIRFDNLGDK